MVKTLNQLRGKSMAKSNKHRNPKLYQISRMATLMFAVGLAGFYIYPFGETNNTPWMLNFIWIILALFGIAQLFYRNIVLISKKKVLWGDVIVCCFVSIFPLLSPLTNSVDGLIACCLFILYEIKVAGTYCQ